MITVTVLTKKQNGAGHHSTEVSIDFSGLSQEQILLLARARVVDRWQREVKAGHTVIPSEITLNAADYVQPERVISDEPLNLPKPKDYALERLLEGLSATDKQQMLALLEGM